MVTLVSTKKRFFFPSNPPPFPLANNIVLSVIFLYPFAAEVFELILIA